MPDAQPTREGPAERLDRVERDVLYLLTGEVGDMQLWSIADLAREVKSDEDVRIAVRGLLQAGLVYEPVAGYVFASRAAVRFVGFTGHVS